WLVGTALPGATDQHLQLAARRHHRHDRASRLATAPHKTRHAATLCDSGRKTWTDDGCVCRDRHERCGATGKRQVRTALGTGGTGGGATDISCPSLEENSELSGALTHRAMIFHATAATKTTNPIAYPTKRALPTLRCSC